MVKFFCLFGHIFKKFSFIRARPKHWERFDWSCVDGLTEGGELASHQPASPSSTYPFHCCENQRRKLELKGQQKIGQFRD